MLSIFLYYAMPTSQQRLFAWEMYFRHMNMLKVAF